jgi:hypothetical protein
MKTARAILFCEGVLVVDHYRSARTIDAPYEVGTWPGDGHAGPDDLSFLCGPWLVHDCDATAGAGLNGDCTVTLVEFAAFAEH